MAEPQSFPVHLRDGSQVPATIDCDPSPEAVALARESFRLEVAKAKQLAAPTGRYNCHGLVLASRRANIPPVGVEVDLDDVLERDGFYRLDDGQAPQVGDIVAYRANGEIEHTGLVTRVYQDVGSVFIWSAWGGLCEFEHLVHGTPYGSAIEFWRRSC